MSFKTGTVKHGAPSDISSSIYSLLNKLQNVNNNEQNTMILHPGAIGLPKGRKLPTKKELYQQKKDIFLCHAK